MPKPITTVPTEIGNRLILRLKNDGWRITNEYKLFDKGIDFDAYTLESQIGRISLQWDNWMEWEISGSKEVLDSVREILAELQQ